MRIITITTASYAIHVNRLIRSIGHIHPNASIIVYTDRAGVDRIVQNKNVETLVLPEIDKYGVKRAKFFAYADAAGKGGFIYLDADILVTYPLLDLLNVDKITACRDDLRECSFIPDPHRPWETAPHLTSEKYFNSGVFAVPSGCFEFFDSIRKEALDDDEWCRYTIHGKLYDNHFLCAKIAQNNIPVGFISEYEYNWQGFRSLGELNCYVDDSGRLRSHQAGNLLRLVHFAGIGDIDSYIAALPPEIALALAGSIGKGDVGVLEMINFALNTKGGIESRLKSTLVQAMCQSPVEETTSPGAEISLVGLPPSIESVVHSVQETDFLWNGLKCGSASLSAAEYQRLRSFIVDAGVRAVLEVGAGYTTALFARIGCKQVALDGWGGPWLEFARAQGADARLVLFAPGIGFDDKDFIACAGRVFSTLGKKMVFIGSPPGMVTRSSVVEQVLRLASDADFYIIHNSVRDSPAVYRLCSVLGLVVIDHFPSLRGLTFLGKRGAYPIKLAVPQRELKERLSRMRFEVRLGEKTYASGGNLQSLFLHLINTGEEVITTAGDALKFSMHQMNEQEQILQWDTPRYSLPVDLQPNDCISFWVDVSSFFVNRSVVLFDLVKEGEFWWSALTATPCQRLTDVELKC